MTDRDREDRLRAVDEELHGEPPPPGCTAEDHVVPAWPEDEEERERLIEVDERRLTTLVRLEGAPPPWQLLACIATCALGGALALALLLSLGRLVSERILPGEGLAMAHQAELAPVALRDLALVAMGVAVVLLVLRLRRAVRPHLTEAYFTTRGRWRAVVDMRRARRPTALLRCAAATTFPGVLVGASAFAVWWAFALVAAVDWNLDERWELHPAISTTLDWASKLVFVFGVLATIRRHLPVSLRTGRPKVFVDPDT